MNESTSAPNDGAPNPGQDVNDETEPAEEYELDQATDERDSHAGQSLSDEEQSPSAGETKSERES